MVNFNSSSNAINLNGFDAVNTAVKSPILSTIFTLVTALLTWILYSFYLDSKYIQGFPIAGKAKGWDFRFSKTRWNFYVHGRATLQAAVEKYKGRVFQVISHSSPLLVIPPELFEDIRNHPDAPMMEAAMLDFFPGYKSFDTFHMGASNHVMINVVQKKLTPLLTLITEPVNDETNIAMTKILGDHKEWTKVAFNPAALTMVSQISSRIFLGTPICRNEEWIKIGKDYTVAIMTASFAMQLIPRFLRPLIYRWLPPMTNLKRIVKEGRAIIQPEADRRTKAANEAFARGEKPKKHLDALDWMLDVKRETGVKYDITAGQLGLTFAAVHTTSTTITHLMYDIIENPELIAPIREEIIAAYNEDGGWQKTTLFKLKLLDSVMKESQRMNPMGILAQTRLAQSTITLKNGEKIPKGTRFYVHAMHLRSPDLYDNPDTFDGYRFLNLRSQPGNSNKYQYVTTSMEHNIFGHGQHACPGRFFASNELKLMMAHLLMKYDWKFIDDKRPAYLPPFHVALMIDPEAEILYKSRKPEIAF